MTSSLIASLLAAVAVLPLSLLPWQASPAHGPAAARGETAGIAQEPVQPARGAGFVAAVVLAAAGTLSAAGYQLADGWNSGLSLALIAAAAMVALLFGLLAGINPETRGLTPLVGPYLLLLALAAGAAGLAEPGAASQGTAAGRGSSPDAWLFTHIVLSVTAYGTLTLAAIAGLSVIISEAALKRRQRGPLSARLPALAHADRLQHGLMAATLLLMCASLMSGLAEAAMQGGALLTLDHKTVLSLSGMAGIALLLLAERRWGLRGRRASRFVLAAFLVVSLAFPGVKLVTEFLLSG